jgi:hypothetical protein
MSNPMWKKEIERKYIIQNISQFKIFRQHAIQNGLISKYSGLQRDWVPDFAGSEMKNNGILLRVRHTSVYTGNFPEWIITLKIKNNIDGLHKNHELEATSESPQSVQALEADLEKRFQKKINLLKLASLGQEYASKVGLIKHRILLEKKREEFSDLSGGILLAFDQLPMPLGTFLELETREQKHLLSWEVILGLKGLPIAKIDYGEMVKNLSLKPERTLVF